MTTNEVLKPVTKKAAATIALRRLDAGRIVELTYVQPGTDGTGQELLEGGFSNPCRRE